MSATHELTCASGDLPKEHSHTASRGGKSLSLLLLASATMLLPSVAHADRAWFKILLSGEHAGWEMRDDRTTDGQRVTTSEQKLSLSRGAIKMVVHVRSEFTQPLRESTEGSNTCVARVYQVLGALPQDLTYRFKEDSIEMISVQGDSRVERSLPAPERPWLPPGDALDLVTQNLTLATPLFSFTTLEPTLGMKPIDITYTLESADVVIPGCHDPQGTPLRGSRWKVTVSSLPGLVTREYYDNKGTLQRVDTQMAGMDLSTLRSTREEVMKETDAPELIVNTLVRPSKPLKRPRQLRRLRLRLKGRGDSPLPDLPTMSIQHVERIADNELLLTIDLDKTSKSDPPDAKFLRSSTMLNFKDERVEALARRALEEAELNENSAAADKAEALRRFVERYIERKHLDTGFATATEVALRKTGDCSEHGVLLAALLRGVKIPSRVVTGLMYVDEFVGESGVFGYHMWCQAYVDGRWIELDAVLPRTAVDATHIILATNALTDDESLAENFGTLLGVMGNLEIEVEETGYETQKKAS